MRPIDGNELQNRIQRRRDLAALNEDEEIVRAIDSILVLLSTSVTLDYVPVIHAQWECLGTIVCAGALKLRCTHCKQTFAFRLGVEENKPEYCLHCGAKMDKESTPADMFDEY